MGRNRFRQYSLNKRVRIGRGRVALVEWGSFFKVKIPNAMNCIKTSEKIVESWTTGQNFPPDSYFGAYTFKSYILSS